jgi:hypothetical protein
MTFLSLINNQLFNHLIRDVIKYVYEYYIVIIIASSVYLIQI